MCIVNNTYIVSIESVIVRYKNLDYFHFGALNADEVCVIAVSQHGSVQRFA